MAKQTEKNNEHAISGYPSDSQIAAWKKEHGKLHEVKVKGKVLIFRQPKMLDLEIALSSKNVKNPKPYDFERSIIANCKVYEQDNMLSDDECMLGVITNISDIIKIAEATIKEL